MIVALYARVSTSKQAEKDLSIPDQVSQMRAWCRAAPGDPARDPGGRLGVDEERPVDLFRVARLVAIELGGLLLDELLDERRHLPVEADPERELILVKGAVPGPRGGVVIVRNAVKGGK